MDKKVWEYIAQNSKQEILEWKVCKWTGEEFPIFEKEGDILKNISPNFPIKHSHLSPESRLRTLLMWRNERKLYRRKSDLNWKNILSIFPSDCIFPVYQFQEYGTDAWNPFDYAQEIQEKESLRSQISNFFSETPKRWLNIAAWATMENCDYCNYGFASKDCYMCQIPLMSEQCYYSHSPFQSKYNFDCYLNEKCEHSYESSYCIESYKIFYSDFVESSHDCYFCSDIQGSKNCIWCIWISWKQYHIFNKIVSQEIYEKKLKEIFDSYESVELFKKEFEVFRKKFPKKHIKNLWSENSYGNIIRYCKDATFCFGSIGVDTALYSTIIWLESHHLLSCQSGGSWSSYVYQTVWFSASNNSAFNCFGSGNNCFYNYDCRDCEYCMFSVWLMNQKYCIFNKQYTEEEYKKVSWKLLQRLEEEWIWWEFFPSEICVFPYNDSPANNHYPVEKIVYLDTNKKVLKTETWSERWKGTVYVLEAEKFISEAILDLGWDEKIDIKWRTQEVEHDLPIGVDFIEGKDLAEIQQVDDSITDTIILCEISKRPYRIISQELAFYKKYNIPLPRKHPDTRYEERFKKAPANILCLRKCWNCTKEVLSVWQEDKIICEECYLKSI